MIVSLRRYFFKRRVFWAETMAEEVKPDERCVWTLKLVKKVNLGFLWQVRFQSNEHFKQFYIEKLKRSGMFQIHDVKQEIKSKVREKCQLAYRKNVKVDRVSLAFSNYQNSDARNESSNLQKSKYLCDKKTFDCGLDVCGKKSQSE